MLVEPLARTIQRLGPAAGDADLLRAFTDGRSDDAFAALVRRHGPMVFGVCRRALGHSHDAEDAFQAVFLVPARKARNVRGDGVGRWLYGVAVRVARKARRRRDRHPAVALNVEPPTIAPTVSDEGPVIDAMIAQLPTRHRDALILCDVQGWSRADAARHLGIAEGTLSSRLSRARERVRARLVRRGIVPALLLAVSPVPAALVDRTLTHTASTLGRELAAGVIHAMTAAKFAKLLTLAACVAAVGGVGYLATPGTAADPKSPPAVEPVSKKEPPPAALSDADRIKGTWVVESASRNGKADKDGAERSFTGEAWTFDGESTQIPFFGKKKFAYRLDPGWDLKRMDIDLRDHMRGGKLTTVTVPCIYKFEGERLHLMFGVVELDERPASFEWRQTGPPFTHFVLKREPKATAADEVRALQGEWKSVAMMSPKNGREDWAGASLRIDNQLFRLRVKEEEGALAGTFAVDVNRTMWHIDLTMTAGVEKSHEGKVVPGVFRREGDTLRLALSDDGVDRPCCLEGKENPVMVFERARPGKGVEPKVAEKPATPKTGGGRLRELQEARVKVLRETMDRLEEFRRQGLNPAEEILDTARELCEAEREVATTPAEHLAAAEKLFRLLAVHDDAMQQGFARGIQPAAKAAKSRAARLKAEIEVEKLKAAR